MSHGATSPTPHRGASWGRALGSPEVVDLGRPLRTGWFSPMDLRPRGTRSPALPHPGLCGGPSWPPASCRLKHGSVCRLPRPGSPLCLGLGKLLLRLSAWAQFGASSCVWWARTERPAPAWARVPVLLCWDTRFLPGDDSCPSCVHVADGGCESVDTLVCTGACVCARGRASACALPQRGCKRGTRGQEREARGRGQPRDLLQGEARHRRCPTRFQKLLEVPGPSRGRAGTCAAWCVPSGRGLCGPRGVGYGAGAGPRVTGLGAANVTPWPWAFLQGSATRPRRVHGASGGRAGQGPAPGHRVTTQPSSSHPFRNDRPTRRFWDRRRRGRASAGAPGASAGQEAGEAPCSR